MFSRCGRDQKVDVQPMPITTNVMSLWRSALCDKFCQGLRQDGGFLRVLRHDILVTKILLKVALITLALTITPLSQMQVLI